MKRENKIFISLILAVILMVILSGCSGLPKTAKINVTIDPNPVSYSSENEKWSLTIIFEESNGIGVSITSLTFNNYDQEDQLISTQVLDAAEFLEWFEANYIPAFSSIQGGVSHHNSAYKYTLFTVEGVDDDNNPIEATGRADFLPQ